MKKYLITALAFLCCSLLASAGVVKGAASDVKVAAKLASYPVRHPVKSLNGASKAASKALKGIVKAISAV